MQPSQEYDRAHASVSRYDKWNFHPASAFSADSLVVFVQ